MSDDMLIHFSSNSSNQSDQSLPTKIAKLEARMVGKTSSAASNPAQSQQQQQQQPTWSSVSSAVKLGSSGGLPEQMSSSDSDDDNGGEFLIQANTQKRQRIQDDKSSSVFELVENTTHTVTEGRQKTGDLMENKINADTNKRKHGCGRGHSAAGRGRGSRGNDQKRSQISAATALTSNENKNHIRYADFCLESRKTGSKDESLPGFSKTWQSRCHQSRNHYIRDMGGWTSAKRSKYSSLKTITGNKRGCGAPAEIIGETTT